MSNEIEQPDPAAVFACALSLWRECMRYSRPGVGRVNFSECYNGGDEFMRVLMRVGTKFEQWACSRIAFDALEDVWPYVLEVEFGAACIALLGASALDEFADNDCLRVALRLSLPVKITNGLPVPVDVVAGNPIAGSEFRQFRIQTVRECAKYGFGAFTSEDDPFDKSFTPPVFGLYGVFDDGLLEHIADFETYAGAVGLVRNLAPGILFPDTPHSR